MIDELQLFRGRDYIINEHIKIKQPTIEEICEYGEQKYYSMISTLCATPSEYKVQLNDIIGIDWETISDFEFFSYLGINLKLEDTSIILGDLELGCFKSAINNQNDDIVLYDDIHDIVIDQSIYSAIVSYLRIVHGFTRISDKAGNANTRKYILDKERKKQKYHKNEKYKSMLVPLVSAMTNCEQFKYNHDTVWKLHIYPFMDSVKRIQKLQNYNQMMQGVYTGNVDFKKLSKESLNWMGSLNEN